MANRREFLKQSTGLIGLSALDFAAPAKPLLSFSTLGCPAWTFSQVLQHAAANNYQGIEIRGIKGDLGLPNNPLFSASKIAQTKREIADSNSKIVNLGSSSNLHFIDAKKRQSNLDDAKKYIDLSHQLKCHFILVFPNDLQKDKD